MNQGNRKMSKGKRYYWLKLQRDFFKRHDIRIIENMPNGKDYILFYLKLLVESIDHDGNLRFSESVPYNEEMLATITNTDIDVTRSAVKIFVELGMMEVLDDGTIYMTEVRKMIGSETDWARQKRIQRGDSDGGWTFSTSCPPTVHQLSGTCPPEKEKEKDKELEREKEKKKIKKEKEKKSADADDAAFNQFWELYPRKVGKGEARRKFAKVIKQVNLEVILAAVKRQRESRQWSKDNGQFVPYPATWLNQERWEDEVDFGTVDSARNYDYDGEDSL